MAYETLIVERDGPVMKVTLNRPDARNALSPQMLAELGQAFAQAREDEAVRVLVLIGAGGNFCAGGDFKGMQQSQAAQGGAMASTAASNRRFGAFLEQADAFPKALIALVEGACMGGGVGLVAVADWVIADSAAQIGTPEVTVGIVPAQITPFVVQRIGTAHARRLTAFGLRLTAQEAHRIGLVHEVAANHGEVLEMGAAAINQCLRCAPGAVAETKKLVRASARGAGHGARQRIAHVRGGAGGRCQGGHPCLSREAQAGVAEEDRAVVMTARAAASPRCHAGISRQAKYSGTRSRGTRAEFLILGPGSRADAQGWDDNHA
ncbi:MAG: enoyl-CoA hydratase/isomerase family protein [Hyphomonadaceae bacterium]|jgi:isohexenylglutaconyl-CoA hydratase|nr:enoyl-CoA hydratase/isomerase family protein [Hyphomonadaceae bacterium]